jgi:hypothetical protein
MRLSRGTAMVEKDNYTRWVFVSGMNKRTVSMARSKVFALGSCETITGPYRLGAEDTWRFAAYVNAASVRAALKRYRSLEIC